VLSFCCLSYYILIHYMHYIFTDDGWTGIAGRRRMDLDNTLMSIGGATKVMIIWDNIHEEGFQDKLKVFQYTRRSISVNQKKRFIIQEEAFQYIRHLHILKVHCDFSLLIVIFCYLFILCILYSEKTAGRGSQDEDGWTWTTRLCPLVEIPR
jgi:hypothetical protein